MNPNQVPRNRRPRALGLAAPCCQPREPGLAARAQPRLRFSTAHHLLAAVLACLVAVTVAHAASPQLNRVDPAGAQRGTERVFTFDGPRLHDAQEVLFYRPGVSTKSLEVVNNNTVRATLVFADDCPLGEHPVRLRTASGVTDLHTIWVGDLPIVAENEPNSTFESPQAVPLNTTVEGTVANEDVDYFVIEAKQGQPITVEVEAMRLGGAMFDAYAAILDADRFELAAYDDSALLLQDPVASVVAPADGQYIVQIREASYGGGGNHRYRMHIGDFPRPAAAYPAGGRPGETLTVALRGDALGDVDREVTLPETPTERWPLFEHRDGWTSPSPLALRVVDLPNILENEPNNGRREATDLAEQSLPAAINGVIESDGDHDWFRFSAKKGEVYDIEVYARRLRSPLDAVLNVFEAGGKHLAGNDDSRGPDPYQRFRVPADGQYELRVRDHLGRGGPTFVYRVELTRVTPSATLQIERVNRNRPQERQTIDVPRGGRFATLVRLDRADSRDELSVKLEGLPEGMTADARPAPGHVRHMPVVFEAAPEAPLGGALAQVNAEPTDADRSVATRFAQDVPLVVGQPNRTEYYATSVDRLAVAVTEAAPFSIRLVEPAAPIVRNGTMQLRVVAERDEGFDKPITLHMLWNPPGLSSAGAVTIGQGETEALYAINAGGNAEARDWPVAVLGRADVQGQLWTSTQLGTVTVAEPYVTGTLDMAASEQGQTALMLCKLSHARAFEGQATLRLLGLPPKTQAPELTVEAGQVEAVFEIAIEPDARPGVHKGLLCELVLTESGEPVVHRFAHGGTLRIDRPRVQPEAKPEPKQEKPTEQAKPEAKPRPLSRLEQLRLERERRLNGE